MRYLLISDLHSNWDALEAVLDRSRGYYDRIVCCGDIVGYGPEPDRVVEWARENLFAAIRGNHDRACCGLEDLEWFNPVAQVASRWTMAHMSAENLNWLRELPQGPVAIDGFAIAHGSPLDEDEYVTSLSDAANLFDYLDSGLTFFGHTHLQGAFAYVDGKKRNLSRQDFIRLEVDGIYLVNPGSVGQPRDGDARAAYALFDSDTREITLERVPYDYGTVARKIAAAGLPTALGSRLSFGR